jgi:hypothetical protein
VRANAVTLESRCSTGKHPESIEGCGVQRPGISSLSRDAWTVNPVTTCEGTPEGLIAFLHLMYLV